MRVEAGWGGDPGRGTPTTSARARHSRGAAKTWQRHGRGQILSAERYFPAEGGRQVGTSTVLMTSSARSRTRGPARADPGPPARSPAAASSRMAEPRPPADLHVRRWILPYSAPLTRRRSPGCSGGILKAAGLPRFRLLRPSPFVCDASLGEGAPISYVGPSSGTQSPRPPWPTTLTGSHAGTSSVDRHA
jgi:hypothetical protein